MRTEGTTIKPRYSALYFDNVHVTSIKHADEIQNELNEKLIKLQGEIQSLAISTPKDITPDGESPIEYIKEKVNEIIDDLFVNYEEYFTVDIIKNILNEWSYSCIETDEKELYTDSLSDEDINKLAFIQDEHVEIKRNVNKFSFAPDDNDIQNTIDRCIQNIRLNDKLSEFTTSKYIIIYDNKIYTEFDGQFIFNSKEYALSVLQKKMDLHTLDYISSDFIKSHPSFFTSIKYKFGEKIKEDFFEKLNTIKENDYIKEINTATYLYKTLQDAVIEEVFNLLNIKIIKLGDLIKLLNLEDYDIKDITKEEFKKSYLKAIC